MEETLICRDEIEDNSKIGYLLVDRIKETIEAKGLNKGRYAVSLGWLPSKLSKILSHERKISVSEAALMVEVLGYTLDKFVLPEFDLEKLEQENRNDTKKIGWCIDASLSNRNDPDRFREGVYREFPRTIKSVLELEGNDFEIVTKLNKRRPHSAKKIDNAPEEYVPQITLRYKGLDAKGTDNIVLGYWFDTTGRALALAICYAPELMVPEDYSDEKKKYYRSLLEDEGESYVNFDFRRYAFPKELRSGDIISIFYDFRDSNNLKEEKLVKDLKQMFFLYKKLVTSIAESANQTYWGIFDKIMSEGEKDRDTAYEDFKAEIVQFVRSGPRNSAARQMALLNAEGHCEFCGTAETFLTKDGDQYFDIHHLVPLQYRAQGMEYDIESNIICLCPNCHSQIHHASDDVREKMVVDLYYKRKNALAEDKINVSLAKLLKMYKL